MNFVGEEIEKKIQACFFLPWIDSKYIGHNILLND